jgi:protein-L-isoaspartate(D-aspartate) O-methyltransferase
MVESQLVPRGIHDERVLRAMAKVPRERFVEGPLKGQAYADHPLPIAEGQTISQPYIVALMTQVLEMSGKEKVLEIVTGSGYQTAILAEAARTVYTVERIAPLLERARNILEELDYQNIHYKLYNGTFGWGERAPYDAVVVTAGTPRIPPPLFDQLDEGGRLVAAVGDRLSQALIKITKRGGRITQKELGSVRFVGLVGEYGWQD